MSARLIQVIETTLATRGDGKETPYRHIKQYWSLEGELLAEVDPMAEIYEPDFEEWNRVRRNLAGGEHLPGRCLCGLCECPVERETQVYCSSTDKVYHASCWNKLRGREEA